MTDKVRVFVYEGQEYTDPNPELSHEEVRDLLARTFGALRNGRIEAREEETRRVITFSNAPRSKGCGSAVKTLEKMAEMGDVYVNAVPGRKWECAWLFPTGTAWACEDSMETAVITAYQDGLALMGRNAPDLPMGAPAHEMATLLRRYPEMACKVYSLGNKFWCRVLGEKDGGGQFCYAEKHGFSIDEAMRSAALTVQERVTSVTLVPAV